MNFKKICNKKIPDSLTWILLVVISIYQHYFEIYMYASTHWLQAPEARTLMTVSGTFTLVFLFLLWLFFTPLKSILFRVGLAFLVVVAHGFFHPTY